jgi:hypothetical protein
LQVSNVTGGNDVDSEMAVAAFHKCLQQMAEMMRLCGETTAKGNNFDSDSLT